RIIEGADRIGLLLALFKVGILYADEAGSAGPWFDSSGALAPFMSRLAHHTSTRLEFRHWKLPCLLALSEKPFPSGSSSPTGENVRTDSTQSHKAHKGRSLGEIPLVPQWGNTLTEKD